MPARARAVLRAVKKIGGSYEKPKSGSHWHVCFENRVYPIPLHNGMRSEIPDVYLRGLARFLGITVADLKAAM